MIVLVLELQINLGMHGGAYNCFIISNEINGLYWELIILKHGKKHKSERQIWSALLSTMPITEYPGPRANGTQICTVDVDVALTASYRAFSATGLLTL